MQSFCNVLRDSTTGHTMKLAHDISQVTKQDMSMVFRKYFSVLFDVHRSNFVACVPSLVAAETTLMLRNAGRPLVEMATIERCCGVMVSVYDWLFAFVIVCVVRPIMPR